MHRICPRCGDVPLNYDTAKISIHFSMLYICNSCDLEEQKQISRPWFRHPEIAEFEQNNCRDFNIVDRREHMPYYSYKDKETGRKMFI